MPTQTQHFMLPAHASREWTEFFTGSATALERSADGRQLAQAPLPLRTFALNRLLRAREQRQSLSWRPVVEEAARVGDGPCELDDDALIEDRSAGSFEWSPKWAIMESIAFP